MSPRSVVVLGGYGTVLSDDLLRPFGDEICRETGVVFAGLGCPNGCDFCCTSHCFKRKHIRLLPTDADICRVIERYKDAQPPRVRSVLAGPRKWSGSLRFCNSR